MNIAKALCFIFCSLENAFWNNDDRLANLGLHLIFLCRTFNLQNEGDVTIVIVFICQLCYAISSSYQGARISIAFVLVDLTKIKAYWINSVCPAYETAHLKQQAFGSSKIFK